MKTYYKLCLLLLFLSQYGFSQVTNNLELLWNDEFNGNSLDASKWSAAPEWPRQGGSYWSDDNFEMTGEGQVKLQVTEKNGTVYCGAIRTHKKFDQKYGYFETRCKLPQIQGGWAAFWLMPYGNNPGGWGNDGTEMDVFESINGWNGKIQHALHWDGYGEDHQKLSQSTSRPDLYDNQYHTFGMMWTPEEYIFYIDNVESWRTDAGGVSDVNQYLKLTLEVSSDTWAGNWKNQVTKPIDWLIDYVRVYNYQPTTLDPKLNFTVLKSGTTYYPGDQVKMNVDLTGDYSKVDEIRFIYQKEGGNNVTQKTDVVSSNESTYWHTWVPTQAGDYKLKAVAYKNGTYVTNVVANIEIKQTLQLSFTEVKNGDIYPVGNEVEMHVALSGDFNNVDELRFITEKSGQSNTIQKTSSVTNSDTIYWYKWTPTEAGSYALKVLAFKNSTYVTTIIVNVTVENPFKIIFKVLENNQTYSKGSEVKMHIDISGDASQADQIKFYSQKSGENDELLKTSNITSDLTYWYKWVPKEVGSYKLKGKAFKNGLYVTNVVVDVIIDMPLNLKQINNTTNKTWAYPNPTHNSIRLNIDNDFDYEIFDSNSRLLLNGKNQTTHSTIDLSTLPNGNYTLKIKSKENTKTVKIVKI